MDKSITAVMVTGHDPRRRRLARTTARAFLNQTYRNAELLIINQGSLPLCENALPRVREVLDGRGLTVGALRNLAWQYATGELMTCWDDDDVYDPERLTLQMSHYTHLPLALDAEIYCHLGTGESLVFTRRTGFENTLVWPRACQSRYANLPRSSDSHFQHALCREYGGIDIVANRASLYVRLFHGRNIWNRYHFFQVPRKLASNPRQKVFAVRDVDLNEQRIIQNILSHYRSLSPAASSDDS